MCTAVTYKTKEFYFGRTLDNDFSYAEEVTVTPRNFPLSFRCTNAFNRHYAIIGMAYIPDNYPLYYDAVNEKGLCMAGLNFVGNAYYGERRFDKINLSQFEFIPYVLGICATVKEALKLLEKINLVNIPYNKDMPCAQLHWLIADKEKSITVEFVKEGLKIYDNVVGVLTNNPPFKEQTFNLNNYRGLSPRELCNTFSDKLKLDSYCKGLGALGLPGDLSSQSRFVRAAFVKLNSVSGDTEEDSVNQFFHILGSVEQQRGACVVADGKYEITVYTSCCSASKGIYYYTTYGNHRITAVDMFAENIDGFKLCRFPIKNQEDILFINKN